MRRYLLPATVDEALALLAAYDGRARIIAGGTDILLDLHKGKLRTECLVDITRIPELGQIDVSDGWVTIGAAVPFSALRAHPYLAGHVHALVDAAASVGAPAIQTSATWVGNLVQAMPAADGAIIAAALEADVRVLTLGGTAPQGDAPQPHENAARRHGSAAQWQPVASLYAGPGRSTIDSTQQLVTHIRFPLPRHRWGTGWRRMGRRPSLVLPTLNCAVKIVLAGALIETAAIAMGPVGPCPIRATGAEAFLAGRQPGQETFSEAAQLALCDADPRSSALRASRGYRLAVLPVLVEEALTSAAHRAAITEG